MSTTTTNAAGPGRHRRRGHPSRWVAVGVVVVGVAVVLSHPFTWSSTENHDSPVRPIGGTAAAAGATAVPLDPAAFANGSCVALAASAGNRHQTVYLDAGHGGPDPGASSGATDTGENVQEKAVTLPVALDTARLLRARGYRVVLSRTTDDAVARLTSTDLNGPILSTQGKHNDLIARVTCANLSGAAALVSVHFDAYSDPSVGGATTIYDAVRPFSSANLALANALQHDILASLAAGGWSVLDRGIADDTTTGGGEITDIGNAYGHLDVLGPVFPGYVDNPTTMPGALVEPLFLTNPDEAAIAVNPAAQHAIATGIAGAVDQFLRTR